MSPLPGFELRTVQPMASRYEMCLSCALSMLARCDRIRCGPQLGHYTIMASSRHELCVCSVFCLMKQWASCVKGDEQRNIFSYLFVFAVHSHYYHFPTSSLYPFSRLCFLDGPGSNPGRGEIFRTCPDRPWGPPSLLYNGYRIFPEGKEWPGRGADTSPLLVPWSRKSRVIPLLAL